MSSQTLLFTVFPRYKKVRKRILLLENTAKGSDQQLQLDFNCLCLLIDLKLNSFLQGSVSYQSSGRF